jgi:hypothetical protein
LRALRDSYGGDPNAFTSDLIVGVGLVFNRFNGRADERNLVTKLSQVPIRDVGQRVESECDRNGQSKLQNIAATVVDIYNRGRKGKERLPDWWKGSSGNGDGDK